MNNARDIRSLRDYSSHFAKYNKRILNTSNAPLDVVGIVEFVEGVVYFIPVTYYGNQISDKLLKTFVKGE